VLQIAEQPGMYHVELGRVLGVQCRDICDLASASRYLHTEAPERDKARQFVEFYENLFSQSVLAMLYRSIIG